MSSSGSSSSTSEDSLRRFLDYLGVDERKLESAVRLFEEVANRAEALLVALTPFVERAFASLVTLSEAPEAPGYERLFQERLRYQALMARLTARAAHHLGQLLANEINEGRRVRSIIDEIAKRRECSALVISRRARKLRDECKSEGAQIAIDKAILRTGPSWSASEFDQLVETACEGNAVACHELGIAAEQLAPHLPEQRGRPISVETCTHMVVQELLRGDGVPPSYTFSSAVGRLGDFVDPLTRATRLAVHNPHFSPLHATRLRKMLRESPGSGTMKAARPRRKAASKR